MAFFLFPVSAATHTSRTFGILGKSSAEMIRHLCLVCVIVIPSLSLAQDKSVESRVRGIQVGTLGVWYHQERLLAPTRALRFELGLDGGFWGGSFYSKTGYVLTPVIALEPRHYYNLTNRAEKLRNISGNSANFLTLRTSIHPAWFYFSNYDNVDVVTDVSLVPTWGVRRVEGKHLTYEAGIGLGYQYFFAKKAGYGENVGNAVLNLHLRVGLTW